MRSKLLRTTAVAVVGLSLAAAPAALAQSMDGTANEAAPTGAAPAPTTPPEGGIDEGAAPPNDAIPPATTAPAPDAAAANPAKPPADTAGNMQPAGTVLSEDMTGSTVQSTQGEDLAVLSDLVVAPEGQVRGAILTVGGVLGVGGKEVLVPWQDLTVGSDGETITLAMSAQQLDQMPAFQPLPKESEASDATPAPAAPQAGQ